jgi:modification target Cys-rich repeat protein
MRKAIFGVAALVAPVLFGAVATTGCDKVADPTGGGEGICGPCGTVATGDFSVSGDAKLDGFFQAVGNLQNATGSIRADFEGNVRALALAFGVEGAADAEINADFVGELNASIAAELDANVSGGLQVNYTPAACKASVSVAVDAQAKCEAKAGCDVEVDPGEVSVKCEGKCSGGCSGTCSGEVSCKVEGPSATCSGKCEGSCTLEAAATCEGTCRGSCTGTCSAYAENGQGEAECAGSCDGECQGTCELSAAAECSGSCSGSCVVEEGSAECSGEVECRGSCEGECSGGCEGKVEPPSASANCEASADCNAQASANASASLECTPPSIEIGFQFNAAASADLDAQASFTAKIGELKTRGAAILQGFAKYEMLITGEANGEVVFDPSPLADITGQIEGFANADAIAEFDIAIGRLPCVVPAFAAAASALGDIAGESAATLEAQAEFATAFSGGFGG